MTQNTIKPEKNDINVEKLFFDPENPRFPPEIAKSKEPELIEKFIKSERLQEIVESIADQGYFEGEPLLVVKIKDQDKYHVIEGNRRLAALKILNNLISIPTGRIAIENATLSANHRPNPVPCLIFKKSEDILRYLGFRHITGIKSWSSLQKARYLKRIKETFYKDTQEQEQFKQLAREIGSRSDYVAQILTALNVYETVESNNFYDLTELSPDEIDFSVLSTALGYSNISEYIGLENRKDILGKGLKKENLRNLFFWMFVSKSNQRTILGDSRNLNKLAAIVASKYAIQSLIDSGDLEKSYQLSKGPNEALTTTLKAIEKKLAEAWDLLLIVDNASDFDLELSAKIKKNSASLYSAINSKNEESDGV